ncbi:MAG: SDR family NAD(P)-dependent oxidoreductase [Thermoleophilaceae bacterium]
MALPPPADGSTCLVTGASSGIGAEIARELARRGHGVTLMARREERLRELAAELERDHGIRAEVVSCDVTDESARARAAREIEGRGLTVEVLVNNAGFGTAGRFQDLDAEREASLVRTNAEAVVAFCGVYVRGMIDRGRGAILNVASTAGFQPLPRQATYSASKAFVRVFSEALSTDLHGTGVTVTALCPGPVPTEFAETAGISSELFDGPGALYKQPGDVARTAVDGMDHGRRIVVPGLANRLGTMFGYYSPKSVALPLLNRFYPVGK